MGTRANKQISLLSHITCVFSPSNLRTQLCSSSYTDLSYLYRPFRPIRTFNVNLKVVSEFIFYRQRRVLFDYKLDWVKKHLHKCYVSHKSVISFLCCVCQITFFLNRFSTLQFIFFNRV